MATLIVEAALVANYVPQTNGPALQAALAMFFVFQLFYRFCLDGKQPYPQKTATKNQNTLQEHNSPI